MIFCNRTQHRLATVAFVMMASVVAIATSAEESPRTVSQVALQPKTETPAARLLLPFYLVDKNNPATGTATLFAVRNEGGESADLEISYFEVGTPQLPQDLPPVHTAVTLGPREVKTVNIRDVPVAVDEDGFARGFVLIESPAGTALQGDYFQVTTDQGFANGDRLVNLDPMSLNNDLCRRVTSRYLNGGPFDGGTLFFLWIDSERAPDPGESLITYSVYGEDGEAFVEGVELPTDTVAFTRTADSLVRIGPLVGPAFGVIEFDFGTAVGYVTAVMSASGLYSVGIEGVCLDSTPS